MEAIILNTQALPKAIRERIHSPKVSVTERDGGLVLFPVHEMSELRGAASQSRLTTEKMRAYKQDDKRLDR
jgi:hypothetical protein